MTCILILHFQNLFLIPYINGEFFQRRLILIKVSFTAGTTAIHNCNLKMVCLLFKCQITTVTKVMMMLKEIVAFCLFFRYSEFKYTTISIYIILLCSYCWILKKQLSPHPQMRNDFTKKICFLFQILNGTKSGFLISFK